MRAERDLPLDVIAGAMPVLPGVKEGRDEGESSKNFGCRVGLETLKSRRVGGQEYGSNA